MGLLLADKMATRTGGIHMQNAQNMAQVLRDIENYSWPVTLKTWDNQEFEVVLKIRKEELNSDTTLTHSEYLMTVDALSTKE
jgi:hypothetical protein